MPLTRICIDICLIHCRIEVMPRPLYSQYQDPTSSLWFMFAHQPDDPAVLHITARHQVAPPDAIETFFQGATIWNNERLRFETTTETHILYWAWHQPGVRVLVISCFRRE